MQSHVTNPWLPFRFCVSLSAILVITYLFGIVVTKPQFGPVGYIVLICNLPMVLWFVCQILQENRQTIQALEARIQDLESQKPKA